MRTRPTGALQITEANHIDDAFYCLGVRETATTLRRDFEFKNIPEIKPDPNSECDWLLETLDHDDDILADKFISKDTAEKLLGRTVEAARVDAIVELKRRLANLKARVTP